MNCPRCGKSNLAGAAFCMHCGADIRPTGQNSQPQPQQASARPIYTNPPQPNNAGPNSGRPMGGPAAAGAAGAGAAKMFDDAQSQQKKWVWIAVGALILAAIGIAVAVATANFVSAFGKENQGPGLQKMGKVPGMPDIQKTAKAPEQPNLAVEKTTKRMPDDVRAWLEHLAETERRRGQLSARNMGSVMSMAPTAGLGIDVEGVKQMTDPDAPDLKTKADEVKESGDEVRREWEGLMNFYVSVQPPAECMNVANTYHHALQETGAMIGDVLDQLGKSKEDPKGALQALYAMQNTSKTIDQYGKDTDSGVQGICDKYETRKWFSIQADFGNSNILGAFGTK